MVLPTDLDQSVELATSVVEISGIDAHLLHIGCRNQRRLRQKVNIRHQRHTTTRCAQLTVNLPQIGRFTPSLGRQTDQLAPRIGNTPDLSYRGCRIVGVGVGHRLDPHRIPATDRYITHRNRTGLGSPVGKKRITIFFHGLNCFSKLLIKWPRLLLTQVWYPYKSRNSARSILYFQIRGYASRKFNNFDYLYIIGPLPDPPPQQ